MCIILIGKITKEQHKAALAQNGDGFSLFNDEMGLVKCPTEEQVKKAIGKWGIWHYRIATSGRVDTVFPTTIDFKPLSNLLFLLKEMLSAN